MVSVGFVGGGTFEAEARGIKLLGSGAAAWSADGAGVDVTFRELQGFGGDDDDAVRDWLIEVKILGEGELTKKFVVKATAFSAAAKEKIEKAGGTAEVVS